MFSRPGVVAACSTLSGALLGFSFGWTWAWVAAQLLMSTQVMLFARCDGRGVRLPIAAGLFASAMALAAHSGFGIGVPDGYRALVWLPLLALVAAQGLASAASAWLADRLFSSAASRWLLAWPALWALNEWLFAQGSLAMPWLRLGQLQAPGGVFAGALPLGGTLLAGLCMWTCAGLVALAVKESGWRRHAVIGASALVLSCFAADRVLWTHGSGDIDALLLQSGPASPSELPQRLRGYLDVVDETSSRLIVSPQLAIPKTTAALPAGYLAHLHQSLQRADSDLLLGLYIDAGNGRFHNGVQSLGTSGTQRYLKRQLFPFGEFLPFEGRTRAWLESLMPAPFQDTVPGPREAPELWLGGHPVAVMACFELAFPSLWREQAARADLLINVSSDASHPDAQPLRQFRQLAQARALEFQKPLLRSTDIGGSLAIDERGQVISEAAVGAPGHLAVHVSGRQGLTPFARWGDVTVLGFCALMLAVAVSHRVTRTAPVRLGPRVLARAQSGQVLMAAVALLLMSAGLVYLMVNTGQAVTEKTRVTHAADAAAYSAGIVEARALNYDAYMNRAMVANEIAIAQAVSFASWVRYAATAIDNIPDSAGDILEFTAPDPRGLQITAIFGVADYLIEEYTGEEASTYADYVVNDGIGPMIAFFDGVVVALSESQRLVHLNLVAGARQLQVAEDLVKQMDPALHARLLPPVAFDGFTKAYAKNGSAGDERGRLADVTMRSRDAFTRERNWTIEGDDFPLLRKDGALKKRGGTELVGYDEWRGVDTLEVHGRKFGCGRLIPTWCDDIQTPVGWGAVNVNAGGGDAGHGYHGNAYGENGRTADKADSDMREPEITHFSGIPDSRDLANLDPDADTRTGISILVYKSHADTLTSGGAAKAKPSGDLALFSDKPAGGKLVALSRAQVFFDRIGARADGKTERASLYNPYWRVRLVAPTAADRAYAAALQGGLALP